MALKRIRNLFCALGLPVSIEVPPSEGPNPSASSSEAGTAPSVVGTALQHKQSGLARSQPAPKHPHQPRDARAQRSLPSDSVPPCPQAAEDGCGARREPLPEALEPLGHPPASCVSFFSEAGREGGTWQGRTCGAGGRSPAQQSLSGTRSTFTRGGEAEGAPGPLLHLLHFRSIP